MTLLDLIGLELLRGDTAVDIEAMKREVSVSIATKEQEAEYGRQDWRLHTQIQLVAVTQLGPETAQTLIAVHDDWFPSKNKSLSCDQVAISPKFVGALQHLLAGEFADWSLSIEVYRCYEGQKQDVGPIKVYVEKVFAVQALGPLLASGA